MANDSKATYYFQLIGIMFLVSQTMVMAGQFVLGILMALWNFARDIVLLLMQGFHIQNLVLVLIWILLLKYLQNSQIFKIAAQVYDEDYVQDCITCQICQKQKCKTFFQPCIHAFHQQCLQKKYKIQQCKQCPLCLQNNTKQNLFLRNLKHLYQSHTQFAKLFVLISVIGGVLNYLVSYWEFS